MRAIIRNFCIAFSALVLTLCYANLQLNAQEILECEVVQLDGTPCPVIRTVDEALRWVKEKEGTAYDYDKNGSPECVDLIAGYYNFLGTETPGGNGYAYATNDYPSNWKRIKGGIPQKGDILVYLGNADNQYGHVAIYESDYVIWHGKINRKGIVQVTTNTKYNNFSNPYWGLIRPEWAKTSGPSISNVQITNVTANGYTISCTISNNSNVAKVQFPTWTIANGQDDLKWPSVTAPTSGNTYSYNVKISSFNNVRGQYATHIYALDANKNVLCKYEATPIVTVPNQFNVTYHANGGSGAPGAQKKTAGVALTLSSAKPTRTGYTFVGWNTKANGTGTAYQPGVKYTVDADVTLYAQWDVIVSRLDVNSVVDGATYKTGIEGYTFDVIIKDRSGQKVSDLCLYNVQDYYKYVPYGYSYEIKPVGNTQGYQCVGGSGVMNGELTVVNVTWTSILTRLDVDLVLDGVTYETGIEGYNFDVIIKDRSGQKVSDLCLYNVQDYCKYVPYGYSYEIKPIGNTQGYRCVGGSGVMNGKLTVVNVTWTSIEARLDVNLVLDGVTYKKGLEGYTFDVIIKDRSGQKVSDLCSYNVQDYYKYVPYGYSYEVIPIGNTQGYQCVGGSGVMNGDYTIVTVIWTSTEGVLEVQREVDSVETTVADYKFTVRVLDANGRDVSDEYGARATNYFTKSIPTGYRYQIIPVGGLKRYHAESIEGTIVGGKTIAVLSWVVRKYTVNYDANGGYGVIDSQVKLATSDLMLSTVEPKRAGYFFNGWNTRADGKGAKYLSGSFYKDNKDVVLYAQWKADRTVLLEKAAVSKISSQKYTGDPIIPHIEVTLNRVKLVENVDYTLSYADNVNAGKAKITITGLGKYVGSKTVDFYIKGTDISKAKVTGIEEKVYSGNEQIQDNLEVIVGGNILQKDKDYTITYSKNINAGNAAILITGMGGYSGTIKKTFKINAYDISKDENGYFAYDIVSAKGDEILYTKSGVYPEVIATFAGKKLVKAKDFTVSYTNNTAITVKSSKLFGITIKGKGNFKGSIRRNLWIKAKSLQDVSASIKDVSYVNKAGKYISAPVLSDTNGKRLVRGTDYSITYSLEDGSLLNSKSIVDAGSTVIVTITGKKNYEGVITLTYRVTDPSIKQGNSKLGTSDSEDEMFE